MSFSNIIIPARSGSKGWPGKNIRLFDYTAQIIPREYQNSVVVTTDDQTIAGMAEQYNFEVHERSPELSNDIADTRSVIKDVLRNRRNKPNDTNIMLYLTYPERTWSDVSSMYNMFISSGARSMLCRQQPKTHPCLMMLDTGNGTGTQVIQHELYQRQQYPECFEISHYVCMFKYNELDKLNKNMYNNNTRYYSIDRVVDIDSEQDFNLFVDKELQTSKI